MDVIEILEELESNGSRLVKEDLLRRNKDNELLKRVFIAAQDPYVVYYINKFKMPKAREHALCSNDDIIYSLLNELLPQLSSREVTGNAAKETVTDFADGMDAVQQKWFQRIILKNLRCGVQDSTVNKIWPGTIKGFSVSLAETLKTSHDKSAGISIQDEVSYPVRVEPKLDGLRCIAVKSKGVVTMYTRNGTILETLPTIKAALEAARFDDIVLDGEAMGEDWNESASVLMSRKDKKDDSKIVYNVFDTISLDDWVSQKNDETYERRLMRLLNTVISNIPSSAPIRLVPGETVESEAQLMKFYSSTMGHGYEGIMLKDLTAPYRFKRSDAILKMKPVTTYEGVIVGHYEGRRGTKREGLFSGFQVVLPNGVVTRVGGGFDDKLKASIQLEGPDGYIGRIVEIEAQPDPLTTDGLTYDGKARFPVFTRFRDPSDVDPKVIEAGRNHKVEAHGEDE